MVKHSRSLAVAAVFAAGILALGMGQSALQNRAEAQADGVEAPRFEIDPFWPKPLPNNWLLGMAIGVWAMTRTISGSSIAAPRPCTTTSAAQS